MVAGKSRVAESLSAKISRSVATSARFPVQHRGSFRAPGAWCPRCPALAIHSVPSTVDRDPALFDLILRSQQGDESALVALMHRCRERLAALLHWRVDAASRGRQVDDDLVNEVLAYAARSMSGKTFESSGAYFNWLATIASSKVIDQKRRDSAEKRGGGRERPFADFHSSSLGLAAFSADQTTPSEAAQRNEILARLPSAIASLSPSEHRAYDLVVLCGMSREEAAREMGIEESSLRGYLTRATTKITAILDLG